MSSRQQFPERSRLNPNDIARHFFNSSVTPESERASAETVDGNKDLTASGRYIVREAKKLIGQQRAFSGSPEERKLLSEEDLREFVRTIEEREGEQLSDRERAAAVMALVTSLDHYDILTPLIENPEVNDIIVRSYNDISIQTNRRNIQTDLSFPDEDSYRSFVEHLLKRAGKACTAGTPITDASPDPHVRVCATHDTLSPSGSGPMLTIRICRQEFISLEALVHYQLAPQPIVDYLAELVASGTCSLLIAGEVGTGKTTLVRALASRIPDDEAILAIEDTHEIVLRRKFVRTIITREANSEGSGRISPALAIRTGMRMAMNRLLLGEMRDAEAAEAFIDVCASGHAGMSTIHARSAKDAIGRLELFLARAQGTAHMDTIRRQIANAVTAVVYLGLDRETRQRRILEVVEIGSYSDGAIQLSPMFRYQPHNQIPKWRREAGVGILRETSAGTQNILPPVGTMLGFDVESLYRGGSQ